MRSIITQAATRVAAIAVILSSTPARGDIINVPGDFATIQAGINAAVNGDEVVLADGTYTGAGNVNCSFNGKLITVRSASGNPEACIIDCEGAAGTRAFTFNDGETSAAVLSGVTITGGAGTGSGGAVNCTFSPTSPVFTSCTFIDNAGNVSGGAVSITIGAAATFHRCRFIHNNAGGGGGGAVHIGGNNSALVAVNCLFDNNVAEDNGGAVNVQNANAQALFINCTLSANVVGAGIPGKEGGGGVWVQQGGTATFQNSIVYNNFPTSVDSNSTFPGTIISTFSNVEDGPLGIGSFDMPPVFNSPNGPDTIPGTLDDDYSLRHISVGIDSGSNALVPRGVTTDIDGNPRFVDDPETIDMGAGTPPHVDMGCYEVQPRAASTCPWDFNGDGDVGGADLGELLLNWGTCGKP